MEIAERLFCSASISKLLPLVWLTRPLVGISLLLSTRKVRSFFEYVRAGMWLSGWWRSDQGLAIVHGGGPSLAW